MPPPHSIYQPMLNDCNPLKTGHSGYKFMYFLLNGNFRPEKDVQRNCLKVRNVLFSDVPVLDEDLQISTQIHRSLYFCYLYKFDPRLNNQENIN